MQNRKESIGNIRMSACSLTFRELLGQACFWCPCRARTGARKLGVWAFLRVGS